MKSVLTRIAVSAACFLFAISTTHGQPKSDAEYHRQSEEIRKTVWAWDKAEFKIKEVPARYAGASSVVIARHTELTADSKSKLGYNGFLNFSANKIMSVSEIVREMVKVNDKSAVEEYSEFSFTRFEDKSGFYKKDNSATFIGVRVIKADGKIHEINADDIVFTNESKSEKKAKVAIPDLQPGDIVDYFIATNMRLTNDFTDKSYIFALFDGSPVLHQSFHGQLGKKFAIDYRSYNGAPDLNVSKNSDDDIVIDVVKKDIPAFETTLWVSPALQLPFIRMFISLGSRVSAARKFVGYSKPGEVNKNKETSEVTELRVNNLALEFYQAMAQGGGGAYFADIVKAAKGYAKNLGLDFKNMADEEKAVFMYYAARLYRLLAFNMDNMQASINIGSQRYNGLALFTYCTLQAADIEGSVLLSNYRRGYRMEEVMDIDDFAASTFLRGTNKFMGYSSVFDIPFEIPEGIEGLTNTKAVNLKLKGAGGVNGISKFATLLPGIKVPVSESGKNAHIEQLILSLTPGESILNVKRKSIIKGHFKTDLQGRLILYEDFYESEMKAFGEKKTLIDHLQENKRTAKLAEDVKNAFAEARKKQKTSFLDETKEWFEQEISNQKEWKIDNMGVRHTAPDFIYSSSFDMDGLVKKAGSNIILEIGKIQGTPMSIKPEQRNRDIDVYMSYPRSVEYHVKVQVPEGYVVEGVEGLNKSVRNETGYFIVQSNLAGRTVEIKVSKHYFHGYETAANWNKLVEFIDAANEWTNAKLLFKKS